MDTLEALLLPEMPWSSEFLAKEVETFFHKKDHIHKIFKFMFLFNLQSFIDFLKYFFK